MRLAPFAATLALALLPIPSQAASLTGGHLDPGFGEAGKRTVGATLPGGSGRGPATVIAGPDDRLYIVGNVERADASIAIAIARLTSDGAVDATFGSAGLLEVAVENIANAAAYGGTFDDSGRLIVVGEGESGGSHQLICRFDKDGNPDTSFGKPETPACATFPLGNSSRANAVLLQHCEAPDNCPAESRIIVAGSHQDAGNVRRAHVISVDSDGELALEFGTSGIAALQPDDFGDHTEFLAIAQDSHGTLLGAGYVANGSTNADMLAVKLGSDGVRMTEFGENGFLFAIYDLDPDHPLDKATAAHLYDDGSALLAGFAQTGTLGNDIALFRTGPTGMGHPNFNGSDAVAPGQLHYTPCPSICDARANAMQVMSDGRIVLAGGIAVGTVDDNELASRNNTFVMRIGTDGTPDPTFGSPDSSYDGLSVIDHGAVDGFPDNSDDVGTSVLLQDDRIVVAGYARAKDPDGEDGSFDYYDFAIARVGNGDGIFSDGFE